MSQIDVSTNLELEQRALPKEANHLEEIQKLIQKITAWSKGRSSEGDLHLHNTSRGMETTCESLSPK